MDAALHNGALAVLLDLALDLAPRLFNGFLDARGMDASVLNQAFERDTRNFTFYGVMAGKRDGLRRIVNDQVNAGKRFECADVAALAPDDPALHLVARQRNDRHRNFRDIIRGAAADGCRDDLLCALVGFILELAFILIDPQRLFVRQFTLKIGKQIIFRLISRKAGDSFKHFKLARLDILGLLQLDIGLAQLVLKRLLLFFKVVELFVDRLLLLLNSAFKAGNLRPAFLHFLFIILLKLVDIVLCLDDRFLFLGFSRLDRIADQTLCLLLGRSKRRLGRFFAVFHTQKKSNDSTHQKGDDDANDKGNDSDCAHLGTGPPLCNFQCPQPALQNQKARPRGHRDTQSG